MHTPANSIYTGKHICKYVYTRNMHIYTQSQSRYIYMINTEYTHKHRFTTQMYPYTHYAKIQASVHIHVLTHITDTPVYMYTSNTYHKHMWLHAQT